MVASGVLERNAGENAAPKKMARSRSTRRDARTATRRVASEPAPRQRGGERWRTFAPSTNGGEPNVVNIESLSRMGVGGRKSQLSDRDTPRLRTDHKI